MIYKTFERYEFFEKGDDVIRYYGNSAREFLKENKDEYELIGRSVKTEHGEGVIIGYEVNMAIRDLYWIVYIPETGMTCYPIVNDPKFYENIIE